jgi:hypothetical protein
LVAIAALVVAVIALIVAVVAVVYAAKQLQASHRYSSAATLVTLYPAFQNAWARFAACAAASPPNQQKVDDSLAEVANLLEIACAIHETKSITGDHAKLLEEYLVGCLHQIEGSPRARSVFDTSIHAPTTFDHIIKFHAAHKKEIMDAVR